MSQAPVPLVIPNSGRWIGNDGTWSTFYIHVGSPPQVFHVLPSISGQTLYVPLDTDCERMNIADCGGQRGVEVFQSKKSLGFQRNTSSTWQQVGTYRMGLGANLGLTGNAYYGYDSFGFGSSKMADGFEVEKLAVAAYATPDLWVGQLGLSMFSIIMGDKEKPHSIMGRLKEEGRIPSFGFGYQAGSPYRFTKIPGSLIIGGYDRTRHSDRVLTVPSTLDTIVGIQSISTKFSNDTHVNLLTDGIIATIDTNVQDIWLPSSVCDAFALALGLTYFKDADRYYVTDAARATLQTTLPVITFTIGTAATGGSTITIELPYAAFDLQARYPIFGSPTYYFPIRRAANETQYTLGRVFLQEAYLSVDWERDVFNISQAVFTSPPLPLDVVTIEPVNKTENLVPRPSQPGKSIAAGAIAGIAIGALGLLLFLAGFVWWLRRRKHNAKEAEATQTLPPNGKKDAELGADDVHEKPLDEVRTDFELDGRTVGEMYAPHGNHEMHGGEQTELGVELVEADSETPIYELPEK